MTDNIETVYVIVALKSVFLSFVAGADLEHAS